MQGYHRSTLPKDGTLVLAIVDTILDSQKHQQTFDEFQALGSSLFGSQWKRRESDWSVLEKLLSWIVELYRDVGDGTLPDGILRFLEGSPEGDRLDPKIQSLESLLQEHAQLGAAASQRLKLPLADSNRSTWGMTLGDQLALLSRFETDFDKLQHLVRFNQLAAELRRDGLGPVVDRARDWQGGPGSLAQLFDFSWWQGLVEKAFSETDSLRLFDRTFAEFEKDASDGEISALADTRTARAFMLLGRVAGTFD